MFGMLGERIPGAQIRPVPSLDPGAPELRAYPRRDEAAPLQMTTAQVGLTLDALVDGAIVGELGQAGEPQLDVVVRAVREDGTQLDDAELIRSVPVASPADRVA